MSLSVEIKSGSKYKYYKFLNNILQKINNYNTFIYYKNIQSKILFYNLLIHWKIFR